jgi:hypothetical protein
MDESRRFSGCKKIPAFAPEVFLVILARPNIMYANAILIERMSQWKKQKELIGERRPFGEY